VELPDLTGIRLVASDLDSTLLTSQKTISERTRAAIRAAHEAGIIVLTATGRQLATMPDPVFETEISYAVASNGAVGYDYVRQEVLFIEEIGPAAQQAVVAYLADHAPGTVYAAGRGTGDVFLVEPGFQALMTERERLYDRRKLVPTPLPKIVSEPTIKLCARHPEITPDELLDILDAGRLPGCHPATSGAPFVEISRADVNKAAGLARICGPLQIGPEQVVAVGDAKNDVEMLRWAGVGVAVANAVPEALAAAGFTTASNDDDGLALVIEALVG
jgi:Cof subfamily protein (haloacid dehalogenase superfamily)